MPHEAKTYSPQYYWDRAEEMRRIAEMMTNPDARQKMLGVVESYEQLARQAEQHSEERSKTPG